MVTDVTLIVDDGGDEPYVAAYFKGFKGGKRLRWIGVTESVEPVKDSFPVEARAFVSQWDRLRLPARKSFGDIPEDHETVRPVMQQAEWVYGQHNNPLRDFTVPELLTIDFAAAFLRWLHDPGNPALWDVMFEARVNIDDVYMWEFSPDE